MIKLPRDMPEKVEQEIADYAAVVLATALQDLRVPVDQVRSGFVTLRSNELLQARCTFPILQNVRTLLLDENRPQIDLHIRKLAVEIRDHYRTDGVGKVVLMWVPELPLGVLMRGNGRCSGAIVRALSAYWLETDETLMELDVLYAFVDPSPKPYDESAAEVSYDAYRAHSDGKSLVSGAAIPPWAVLPEAIRNAWGAVAEAMRDYAIRNWV